MEGGDHNSSDQHVTTPVRSRKTHASRKRRRRAGGDVSPSVFDEAADDGDVLRKDQEMLNETDILLDSEQAIVQAEKEFHDDDAKHLQLLAEEMIQDDWLLNAKQNWNGVPKRIY